MCERDRIREEVGRGGARNVTSISTGNMQRNRREEQPERVRSYGRERMRERKNDSDRKK
jgi:hypothetical protein